LSQSIEEFLKEKAASETCAEELWNKYEVMKKYLSREYYPWIQANCPYFTDHGQSHVESVIQSASQLLLNLKKSEKNPIDVYLILCSIIWHDVGMVFSRSNHAGEIKTIFEAVKNLGFPDPSTSRLVSQLVSAHEGGNGLGNIEREQDLTILGKTHTVFPRALAAILRFSDEISENRSRISPGLLQSGKIPAKNLIYWEYAFCITASRADPSRERVVLTIDIDLDKAISFHVCPEECKQYSRKDGNISLIEYIVARLQKMNNERAYCSRSFAQYSSIGRIETILKLFKNDKPINKYSDTFTLEDSGLGSEEPVKIEIFKSFFDSHPHWAPEIIKEVKNE
jgi:hypothetical protein